MGKAKFDPACAVSEIDMRGIAPTVAGLLGIPVASADGRALF